MTTLDLKPGDRVACNHFTGYDARWATVITYDEYVEYWIKSSHPNVNSPLPFDLGTYACAWDHGEGVGSFSMDTVIEISRLNYCGCGLLRPEDHYVCNLCALGIGIAIPV